MAYRKLTAILYQVWHTLKSALPRRDATADDALSTFNAALAKIDKVYDHLHKNQTHSIHQIERSHHYKNNALQQFEAMRKHIDKAEIEHIAAHHEVEQRENARQAKLAVERARLDNARKVINSIVNPE